MNKKSKGTTIVKVEQWIKIITGGVEQLKGAISIVNDERCFLGMSRLKDLQWSYNSRCDPKFNVIFHIEMIVLQSFYYKH